jgi:hypothetical protein
MSSANESGRKIPLIRLILKPGRMTVGSCRWVRLRTISMNSWLVGTGAICQAAQSAFSSQHDTQTRTYILPCGLHDWCRHKNDSHSLDKEESTIATAAAVLMEAKKFPRRAVSSVGTSRVSMHVTIYSDSTGVGIQRTVGTSTLLVSYRTVRGSFQTS